MNKSQPKWVQPHKNRPLQTFVILLMVLTFTLTGCHFPQPTPSDLSNPSQRQTEMAGILHPTLLPTNQEIPTIEQGEPTIESTPINTAQAPISETPLPQVTPPAGFIAYTTQQGDTLATLAKRFDVPAHTFRSNIPLPDEGLLPVQITIHIPDLLEETLPFNAPILPDSEVIYGPSVGDFDAAAYAASGGGFLATYSETVKGEVMSGPDILQRVALETSTNPRLLLAFLEYQSGWVFGHPPNAAVDPYPIGFGAVADTGLYKELMISAKILAQGFYGWRDGSRLNLGFYGGGSARLSPNLNAGSTALMHLFAAMYPQEAWESRLFGDLSFPNFYQELFGDAWGRAHAFEPYLLEAISQPDLALPFTVGEAWSLTGGPHITWQTGTPRGALDFAPITGEASCAVSSRWVTAAAPGLVARSDRSVVALDLDGDRDEGTGWVLIYMHIAEKDRVDTGTWLEKDDQIGHPSCEGGTSSGTHVHFARKFNGEWLGVGEPLPLVLSGWRAVAGAGRYDGYLQKGDEIVTNRPDGSAGSTIIREED